MTTVHSGNRNNHVRSRVVLHIKSALTDGNTYQWRIPLLKNPEEVDKPLRMNLTLWSYSSDDDGFGAKHLFYEVVNHKKTN